jgi:DMSO/TMAO reductase YedYZ heme-binding membrane subunit
MIAAVSWYVARASGLVAWSLVTASILWGVVLSTRLVRRKGAGAWLLDLHRFLGVLCVVFVAIHVAVLTIDSFEPFTLAELFVPMASSWRPGAVAWGIVGLYLLLAVQLTSWFRRRLSNRTWHFIHLLSFPLFGVSTIHGLQAGHDRQALLVRWGSLSGVLLVVFLVAVRASAWRDRRRTAAPGTDT